jgi:hypothetical protein
VNVSPAASEPRDTTLTGFVYWYAFAGFDCSTLSYCDAGGKCIFNKETCRTAHAIAAMMDAASSSQHIECHLYIFLRGSKCEYMLAWMGAMSHFALPHEDTCFTVVKILASIRRSTAINTVEGMERGFQSYEENSF